MNSTMYGNEGTEKHIERQDYCRPHYIYSHKLNAHSCPINSHLPSENSIKCIKRQIFTPGIFMFMKSTKIVGL
jgi:hypothetical protein